MRRDEGNTTARCLVRLRSDARRLSPHFTLIHVIRRFTVRILRQSAVCCHRRSLLSRISFQPFLLLPLIPTGTTAAYHFFDPYLVSHDCVPQESAFCETAVAASISSPPRQYI